MKDLFIKNSKFDINALTEAKEFLFELKEVIESTYILKLRKVVDYQDETVFTFSGSDSEYGSRFRLIANIDGTITFDGHSIRMEHDEYERLKGEGFKFKNVQSNENNVWAKIKVGKITRDNIEWAVKGIVKTVEGRGNFTSLVLRR